jgi:hypothetical protein
MQTSGLFLEYERPLHETVGFRQGTEGMRYEAKNYLKLLILNILLNC